MTKKTIGEETADLIDNMLEIDGRTAMVWRQASRALRSGNAVRALELLAEVAELAAQARANAELAALGVLAAIAEEHRADPTTGKRATDALINMTTHPHATKREGGN